MSINITYQIEEAPTGSRSWEQTKPVFSQEQEALLCLRAREIEGALTQRDRQFRIRKTITEIITPFVQD